MGTRRTEAFLQCAHLALETSDFALMMVICHRWNDHQIRSLDIGFLHLLSCMPYRHRKHGHRSLAASLRRLVESDILFVRDNGARYLDKRWLRIEIVDQMFWRKFEAMKAAKGVRGGEELERSRALNARPEATRVERAHARAERANGAGTRAELANSRAERASTREHKERKDLTTDKDHDKAAALQDIHTAQTVVDAQDGDGDGRRSAILPAAMLGEPAGAAAVFNTLTLADDGGGSDGVALSDLEWHERGGNAAANDERLIDLLVALVGERWPDGIDRRNCLDQMIEAYRLAGCRGRDLLGDLLAASTAADKLQALEMLVAKWLKPAVEGQLSLLGLSPARDISAR